MWTSASPLCSAEKAGKKFIQKLNSTQERLSVFFFVSLFATSSIKLYCIQFSFSNTSRRNLNICTHFKLESILKNGMTRQLNTKKNANKTLNTFASDHWTQREKQVKIFMAYNNDIDSSLRGWKLTREKNSLLRFWIPNWRAYKCGRSQNSQEYLNSS